MSLESQQEDNHRGKKKPQSKIKIIGKVLIFILCAFGLIYQTWELSEQYFANRTVVNTIIEKITFGDLPAVTVCYPMFVSLEKLSKEFPQIKFQYEIYEKLTSNLTESDFKNGRLVDFLHNLTMSQLTLSYEVLKTSPLSYTFEKLSLPFYKQEVNVIKPDGEKLIKTDFAIEATVTGLAYNHSINEITEIKLQDKNPIESVSAKYERFPAKKCFTFFSKFNPRWNDVNISIENFKFSIFSDKKWISPHYFKKNEIQFDFSMHSPLSLPELEKEDNYIGIEVGVSHEISFSRTTTKLLPPRFLTNCKNYNISDLSQAQSKSDCIDRCKLNTLKEKCGDCIHHTGALYRKELIGKNEYLCNDEDPMILSCFNEHNLRLKLICESQCQNDCHQDFIDYNLKRKQTLSGSLWDQVINVYITHSTLPDMFIEHLPEMTFITFIASFGGLAGMWLGLSALALYDFIYMIINYAKLKKSRK